MKACRVKIYDANPEILKLLAGSDLQVSIMVPNHEIINIASNQSTADQWIKKHVANFYPRTMIRFILVGNEVLSYSSPSDRKIWDSLVPAMIKIQNSLRSQSISKVKVSTPLAMDILQSTFPPSSGVFKSEISNTVMTPLLQFLNRTKSFFSIDVYPYFPWSINPTNSSLDYALFRSNSSYTDPVSNLTYTNMLDQMLDSVIFAMTKLGHANIPLVISETGWPNAGDIDEVGANIYNAATYNRNLIKRMTNRPTLGTPARPGVVIPTFIFSLFDENQKTGPGTERHWGLLHPNGRPIYEIDLTGKRELSDYKALPEPSNNEKYRGEVWCVAANGSDLNELGRALKFACSEASDTCEALNVGGECYEPVSVFWHASYAFSAYWAQFRNSGGSCYFDGLAQLTTVSPSKSSHLLIVIALNLICFVDDFLLCVVLGRGSCKFPSVRL